MTNADGPLLAIHAGALGDSILLARLAERMGGAGVFVARGGVSKLLAGLGVAARGVDFHDIPFHCLLGGEELSEQEQALFHRLPGSVARIVGCFFEPDDPAGARLAEILGARRSDWLPARPPQDWPGHLVEYWAERLGLDWPADPLPPWQVPEPWRRNARERLVQIGVREQPWVIHPGSGGREKCWPLERFVELGRSLPGPMVAVVGPVEADRWGEGGIAALARELPVLADLSLEDLAGVLAEARGFVGNDSGPAHLAGALGVPTVALYGPTKREHFAPLGPAVRGIQSHTIKGIPVRAVLKCVIQVTVM